jgi:hypothetical protein
MISSYIHGHLSTSYSKTHYLKTVSNILLKLILRLLTIANDINLLI